MKLRNVRRSRACNEWSFLFSIPCPALDEPISQTDIHLQTFSGLDFPSGFASTEVVATMPALDFTVTKKAILLLAQLSRHILPTTSTKETENRWENLQECLRMASTATAVAEDRAVLSKVCLVVFTACATSADHDTIPTCLSQDNDSVHLRCHVPNDNSGMQQLQRAAELHLDELNIAERDLAATVRHLSEAGHEAMLEHFLAAQEALALVVDQLQSWHWQVEHEKDFVQSGP